MPKFNILVNGSRRSVQCDADTPLLWVLRDELQLTGTKYGCGMGVCGACTVHQENQAVRSCQVNTGGRRFHSFTTIEGLSLDGSHPCQTAWIEEDRRPMRVLPARNDHGSGGFLLSNLTRRTPD